MAEDRKEAAFRLPPLHTLEAEGREAAEKLAQEILRDTLATGGRIDMKRLDRVGPAVRSAYLHLLAKKAMPPTGEKREFAAAATQPPPVAVMPSTKSVATLSQLKSQPLPRTEVGWHDRQRPDIGFKAHAFRRGMLVAIVLGAIAITAIRFLKL